jgi:hypothetical protein
LSCYGNWIHAIAWFWTLGDSIFTCARLQLMSNAIVINCLSPCMCTGIELWSHCLQLLPVKNCMKALIALLKLWL